MKIYDISVAVPGTPSYPGDPETEILKAAEIKKGDDYNLTAVKMSLHAGTHADAPLHFIKGGSSIEQIPPETFVGCCRVITVYKDSGGINADDVKSYDIKRGERLLLRTRNSIDGHIVSADFYKDYCAIEPSAAKYLIDKGVTLVGIDYASAGDSKTHKIFLKAGVALLEWLDLRLIKDGSYFLSAAPLKIKAEGAPARALLIDFEKL